MTVHTSCLLVPRLLPRRYNHIVLKQAQYGLSRYISLQSQAGLAREPAKDRLGARAANLLA